LEELECRLAPALPLAGPVFPAPLPFPDPLVPSPGDLSTLKNVIKQSVTNRHNLNNIPVPFVILASAGNAPPTVSEFHAHATTYIDADQNPATGQGSGGSGYDIQIEVDSFVDPTPHLVLTVIREGNAPFATNLSVLISFPFAGFDLEDGLPSTPNLVIGFQTRGPGDTLGGIAPVQEVITLTPGTLAGINHSFTATMTTTGASNPLTFFIGNLDGTNITGPLNEAGLRAYVENPPNTINLTFTTTESALGSAINSSFALNWTASSTSAVKLDYLEYTTNPHTASAPDFSTSLAANQMPTSEQFSLALNEAAGTMTLSQTANSVIGQETFQKTRSDGLGIVGNGSSIPTQLGLTLNLAGSATLTENANVGSLAAQASKTGGFAGSSSFLGYNVGTVGVAVTNAPNLSASFAASGTNRTFTAAPTNPGDVIGGIEFIVSSAANPANVQLPTRWSNPAWDIFSLVDTGTGDTAMPPVFGPGATGAARLLNLLFATFTVNTAPLGSLFDMKTTTATPLQSYLRTTPTSLLTPGHDIEITCEFVNIPAGETAFFFNGPTDFGVTKSIPPTSISSIHCFGHIDSLVFDDDLGGVPPVFTFHWDPDATTNSPPMMSIFAQDGMGGNAFLGHLAISLADPNGISLFPDAGALFGTKLKIARMRVDNIPTSTATWVVNDASGNTSIQFNTVAPGLFADGVQFAVSTMTGDPDPHLANAPTPALMLASQYASFNDQGIGARNMSIGVLGVDMFSYVVMNASDMAHIIWDDNRPTPFSWNVNTNTGGVFFAGNQTTLNNTIALVPTHLDYMTTLDPLVCYTGTNFIPSIDLTFGQNIGLPVGTTLTIHMDNLPAVLCYDFEAAAGTLTVLAQNADLTPSTIGDVIFDLESTGPGLAGTAGLLGQSIKQARVRLDNIPSFTASWGTGGGNTHFSFNAIPPGFFLGGIQLELGTFVDLNPLPVASSSSIDYVNLTDKGAGMDKQAALGVFGISQFSVMADSNSSALTFHYVDNAAHELQVNVASKFGQFFHNYNINAMLDIQNIPQAFDLTSDFATKLNYTASSGISSISAMGTLDDGMHGTANAMFGANGLPMDVDFELDASNKATLTMNDAITHIGFMLTDDTAGIFGSPYELITASLDNIPAHWKADWSGGGLDVESEDAGNNPAPMGVAKATVSTSDNAMTNMSKLMPYTTSGPGGTSGLGGPRINYSSYLSTIDDRYFNLAPGGAPVTIAQLQNIYNNAQVLVPGEDHAVATISGSSLDFADAQFTGFQKILYKPNPNGGDFELDATAGTTHPFLAGAGFGGNFLVAHIDNIPIMTTLHVDLPGHDIKFHSSTGLGNIDVYYGPAEFAKDSDTALRAVLETDSLNTPLDMEIKWDFGFPNGTASFVASNPLTLLFLAQDGSHRLVGGFRLQELDVSYGLSLLPNFPSFDVHFGPIPVPPFFGPTSVGLVVFDAHAGINVGPSGFPVNGFFNLYQMLSNPDALNDGTQPGGPQYVPLLTFGMKGFTNFSVDLKLEVELFPALGTPIVSPTIMVMGSFALDFWQDTDINDVLHTIFGDAGYKDPADYTDNTPIQLIPIDNPLNLQITNYGGLVFSFEGFSPLTENHFDWLAP
jgi:hypothetical protein